MRKRGAEVFEVRFLDLKKEPGKEEEGGREGPGSPSWERRGDGKGSGTSG